MEMVAEEKAWSQRTRVFNLSKGMVVTLFIKGARRK